MTDREDQPLVPHLKLLLELDRLEPLGGAVASPDGVSRPFSGWIGLAAAITACLDSRQAPVDRTPPGEANR